MASASATEEWPTTVDVGRLDCNEGDRAVRRRPQAVELELPTASERAVAESEVHGWASGIVGLRRKNGLAGSPAHRSDRRGRELDGEETSPTERVRKRLSLDRHSERVRDLMLWACEFDEQNHRRLQPGASSGELRELADIVASTRWSRRGHPQQISEQELREMQERGLSPEARALELGVRAGSIRKYEYRQRRSK